MPRPVRRLFAVIVAALTVAGLSTAGGAKAEPPVTAVRTPIPTTVTDADVFVVGDSLTVMAAPWFDQYFTKRGWRASVDARNGRTFPEGLRILEANKAKLPPTVIVALGTNDLQIDPPWFELLVGRARQIVGNERRLVFVNLWVDAKKNPNFARNFRKANDHIFKGAAIQGAEVADWARFADERKAQTYYDGVHYLPETSEMRAAFYADSLAPLNTR